MQIDWFTFGAQIVNFLLLIVLLQRFLYKPVVKAMDEREQKIASELEEARKKKVEADEKEKELEQKINEFESQKSKMMDDAKQEIDRKRKQWMDQLRNEIAEIRNRWIEVIENEKSAFIKNLKEETGEKVIELINNVLSDLSEKNLQRQTIDFLLDKLEKLDAETRNKIKDTVDQLDAAEAQIISTFELEDNQKNNIQEFITNLAGRDINIAFKIENKLGFGAEIRMGGWRLGWNMERYLAQLSIKMNQFIEQKTPRPSRNAKNITR